MASPKALVRAYAREAAPLERRGDRGPDQLPSGKAILALDDHGRAAAAVATYEALPGRVWRAGSYGKTIMLGLLATTLLRKKLPLRDEDLATMADGAARAHGPAWGPCDYDMALLRELARHPRLSPKVSVALGALAVRRGTRAAVDRRVVAMCKELMTR